METLNNLTPVLVIGGMLFFMTLETWIPYFEHGPDRKRQRWRNVGMVGIAFIANITLGAVVLLPAAWSEANNFGLLHRLLGRSTLAIGIGIFLFDLVLYTSSIAAPQPIEADSPHLPIQLLHRYPAEGAF